jgi:hypothetical protein
MTEIVSNRFYLFETFQQVLLIMSYRSISTTICAISIFTTSLLPSLPIAARSLTKNQAFPTSGKVLKLTSGDLMCYVDLVDASGKKHTLGADFSVCEQSEFLNQQVRLTYKKIKVSDCQSAEPCGKSKLKNAIIKMRSVR